MKKNIYKIVLASASPRRSEIMKQVNIKFDVIPSHAEEIITKTIPEDVVMELGHIKALDILNSLNETNTIVIGADTVVAFAGKILGKPKSKKEAYEMINSIQDNIHSVYTGVSIMVKMIKEEYLKKNFYNNDSEFKVTSNDKYVIIEANFYVKTDVNVRRMTDKQIEDYISTEEPYDKAGGYGIQGAFAVNILEIQGDYYNVVGLPISRVNQILEKILK